MTALCGWRNPLATGTGASAGVGAGEVGALPPAQSSSPITSASTVARALAVFMSSSMRGYAGFRGGAHTLHDLRLARGIPDRGPAGLALAILVQLRLARAEDTAAVPPAARSQESIGATFRALANKRAFRLSGDRDGDLLSVAYGAIVFALSYGPRAEGDARRSGDAPRREVTAAASIVGTVLGGVVTDPELSKRNLAWLGWWPAIRPDHCWPLQKRCCSHPRFRMALNVLGWPTSHSTPQSPPCARVSTPSRGSHGDAMAVAVVVAFFANLFGLGHRSQSITGALSGTPSAPSHGRLDAVTRC